MAEELLTLQALAKYYTSAQSVVVGLNQTDLTFCRGEFVAITGESGSGKSTLAHVLGGILPYESGELLYKGRPTSHYDSADWERYRRDCVSFISQSYGILPGSSVLDNVTCALRLIGEDKATAREKAEQILRKVELWDLRARRAAKLSSGQKQRLSIARALAKPAPVLIADEPTGNLDAENSTMVIDLLAEAAKDRLVILITHEFSEAEDSVTRHIELHDGRVTTDVRLRDVPEQSVPVPKVAKGERKKDLSWFVARFQIKARPVWSVLMLCLFAATVFAMFVFSGTFISNLDDTFTYRYDNTAFRNGDSRRIVVGRMDGKELTKEDVEQLLSVRYVEHLEEYGYLTDIQYAYREGIDYEVKSWLETHSNGPDVEYTPVQSYSLMEHQGSMPFAQTVPTFPQGREFLTAGRLPEGLYEVVAVGGPELLGERITVLVQDQKNWSISSFLRFDVTVVGVTDYGSHLYFHKDLGRMMLSYAKTGTIYMPAEKYLVGERMRSSIGDGKKIFCYSSIEEGIPVGAGELGQTVYDAVKTAAENSGSADEWKELEEIDPQRLTEEESIALAEQWGIEAHQIRRGEAIIPPEYMQAIVSSLLERQGQALSKWEESPMEFQQIQIHLPSMADSQDVREFALVGSQKMEYLRLVLLHPEDFDEMIYPGKGEQVSVTVEDYAYVDRVLDSIHDMGYVALSPYQEGAVIQDPVLAEQRMQTLRVCLIALLAVIALQILLLRAMFSMETESYRLLSHIGLNGVTAKRSVFWQILLFALGGQVLGVGLIAAFAWGGMDRLAHILRYLPLSYRFGLCLLHLGASAFTAVWTMKALEKQVFPQSGSEPDLDWDALSEEVEA